MRTTDIIEIPFSSALYPSEWKTLSDAPETLYAIGNTELLETRKFTVVGSRRTPASTMKLGEEIAKELSSAFTIVTGTADGGDTAAIAGALQGSGKVMCLLAGGFSALPQGNVSLLERVAEKGLLLSPHPYEASVRTFSYAYRNKLLALLGEGTLVLSASEKSGALITAKYAAQSGRPVFALPYTPGTAAGAGCNALLKKGGILTENSFDISSRFGINLSEEKKSVALSPDEEKLLSVLRELAEGHISELSARAGIPPFKARTLLSSLEIKGLVANLGGNRYAPV